AALHPGQKLLLPGGKELQVVAPGQVEVAEAAVATALEQDRFSDDAGFQVFPNPFNAATLIQLPAGQVNRIRVFDIRGRLVVDLGTPQAGVLRWNGRDGLGRPAPSGTYVISVETPDRMLTRKVTLLR
ncbi:MAG: T9SS type A sorting domain-containing protein, partial [Calditrichaeota bacterium]|nr:T9SS type A sorting domain-containing protein [Calditrichota bacterium]